MLESALLCVASFAVGCCSGGGAFRSKKRPKESSRSLSAARKGRRIALSPTSPRSPSKATQATTTTWRSGGSEPEKTGNLWFKAVRTLSGVFNKARELLSPESIDRSPARACHTCPARSPLFKAMSRIGAAASGPLSGLTFEASLRPRLLRLAAGASMTVEGRFYNDGAHWIATRSYAPEAKQVPLID